jgi:hypothetical protein
MSCVYKNTQRPCTVCWNCRIAKEEMTSMNYQEMGELETKEDGRLKPSHVNYDIVYGSLIRLINATLDYKLVKEMY